MNAAPDPVRTRDAGRNRHLPALHGAAIDAKGGRDSCYAVDYAARTASEAVVRSANRSLLLVSGGEQAGDEAKFPS